VVCKSLGYARGYLYTYGTSFDLIDLPVALGFRTWHAPLPGPPLCDVIPAPPAKRTPREFQTRSRSRLREGTRGSTGAETSLDQCELHEVRATVASLAPPHGLHTAY
jgi:hypothetical protein